MVIPAIDLLGGSVVRLRGGHFETARKYPVDPVAWARGLVRRGAKRLHVVDLDGAKTGQVAHLEVLGAIARAVEVPVQFGGGLRTVEAVESALQQGATTAILGTAAVRQPAILDTALARWGPERVWVAIDVQDGQVAIAGWQERSGRASGEVAGRLAAAGVRWALVTDADGDGRLGGHDETAALDVARRGLRVVAAGGIGSEADVERLAALPSIQGVVIGRALYEGALTVEAALEAARRGREAAGHEEPGGTARGG